MIPRDRAAPLLFEAFPDLAKRVPWTPLAHAPTPVEPCTALHAWLGHQRVYMKRDDLISPLYGGNKVRRYEFVLADAKAKHARSIVTAGGIASTQVMATALFGRALGFDVHAVLFDQPVTNFARQSILGYVQAGAKLTRGGGYVGTAWRTFRKMRNTKDAYLILPGAANALANLGYIDAMLELGKQVDAGLAPKPDVIVLPTGSSGTLAALSLGAAYLGWDTEVIGVRITTPLGCNRATVGFVIRNTDKVMEEHDSRWKPQRHRVRYSLYGDALGEGYGYATPAAIDGIERVRQLTGAAGEVTYSGKAIAALKSLTGRAEYRDKTFLLWNTLSTARPVLPENLAVPAAFQWVFEDPTTA